MPNRLINETSPYLLQHAHNPVDWYPWGEEAFRRAREEDKALLVSIGYSACHWCHVMERESFENTDIAQVMNELFVNIKVDREERPDLDQVYMAAVQTLTGRGGWPLNVFITPEGKPFFGGTYFPPTDQNGMPGLPRVLRSVAQAYRQRRDELSRAGEQLQWQLQRSTATGPVVEPLTEDVLKNAFRRLQKDFDFENGGFGGAPKFPHTMALEFLLRYYQRTRQAAALQMVELALTRMARGGIRDQLGGGFHRYSTDASWLVPHFEKMLYDNALLSRLYLHAYQATGKEFYRLVAEDTLDYVAREMMSPEGGFYSAQDADTEGVEGKYYVWSHEEIAGVLGQDEAEIFNRYFGVTPRGNFEGKDVLSQVEDEETLASGLGLTRQQLEKSIAGSRKRLLEVRERRARPGRDDKVLAAWNGLMLSVFAEAANILCKGHGAPCPYRDIARTSADFLLRALKSRPASGIFDERDLRQGKGLMRSYKDGQARVPGYLEDYASLIDGLLAVHEATFDLRWLGEARSLADTMIEEFWDEDDKVFYDTGRRHEKLFLRPREVSDHVTPSGSSNAAQVLLRLGIVTGKREYSELAVSGLRSARSVMLDYPAGAGNWLSALDFYLSTPKEIAIVGSRADPGTEALVAAIYRRFIPNRVLVGVESTGLQGIEGMPLLEGRGMVSARPTAYVCENFACREPATTPEELSRQLGAE